MRRAVLLLGVAVASVSVVAAAVVAGVQPVAVVAPSDAEPVSSCDGRLWPATVVTCADAQKSVSLGMAGVTETRIWLTTLEAVDAAFRPGRQVADHPNDPSTPVWVFVYDGRQPGILHANESGELVYSDQEDRMIHVADATNPATRDGAFVYIYGWGELDAALPRALPTAPTED